MYRQCLSVCRPVFHLPRQYESLYWTSTTECCRANLIWIRKGQLQRSQDNVVGIATGYGLDDRGVGVRVPVGSRISSSPCRPDRLWGQPSLLSNGYQGLLPPEVKRPGREADQSLPTSAEVKKNMDVYIHSPIHLHGVVFN
jgi:hypothetical protein